MIAFRVGRPLGFNAIWKSFNWTACWLCHWSDRIYNFYSKEMSKQPCLISTLKMTLKSFLCFPLVACPPTLRCVTPRLASWVRYADGSSVVLPPCEQWTLILIILRSKNKTINNSSAPYRMSAGLPSIFVACVCVRNIHGRCDACPSQCDASRPEPSRPCLGWSF